MIVPQTLFKYVRPERVDVIERNLIRYTQPSALNDPFEARPLAQGLASRERILAEATDDLMDEQLRLALKNIPPDLRQTLSDEVLGAVMRVARATLPNTVDTLSPVIASMVTDTASSKLRDVFGILSLTEDPRSSLMWSHYTANGQGFVIGFDTSDSHFNAKKSPVDEVRHLRAVEYRDSRVAGYLVDFTGVEFFYVKPRVWEYEREWRIIRPLEDAHKIKVIDSDSIHLVSMPETAISHVICGYGMAESDYRRLEATLTTPRYRHVKLSRARLSSSEFGVEVSL